MARGTGVLMHLSSLPSRYGIGDMGPAAYTFADALAAAGVRCWQVLPLNPPNPENGESPYFSASAFAGNALFASPELMEQNRLLDKDDLSALPLFPEGKVDYPAVRACKKSLLEKAYRRFRRLPPPKEFKRFCSDQAWWLDDYCLFIALKRSLHDVPWVSWPIPLRDRESETVRLASKEHSSVINRERFVQWVIFSQWYRLKRYCARKNITIIGDLPIYVSLESADVWVNPGIFRLDREKRPIAVSGVPPDYFSATGQLWNNPVYNWNVMLRDGFRWWKQRLRATFERFDIVRIDHFRGLVQYWEVPAGEATAVNGSWQDVPTHAFFDAMIKGSPIFPVIAEDLGIITPDVRETMNHYGFPGMKVLQFAFGEDNPDHPYLPHTYKKNCVAYTGTHDNMPFRAWLDSARPDERDRVFRYIGGKLPVKEALFVLMEKVMHSNADTVILPVQDLLALGPEARMNDPSRTFGNWQWRCTPAQYAEIPWKKLKDLIRASTRG